MGESDWLDLDRAIQDQLALQVELSFDRHRSFMVGHGLGRCRDVVDLGTGSGGFLSRLASQHPAISFHGVDNKLHMVLDAKAHRLSNVEWVQADALDEDAAGLVSKADGILMRYFVLHLPDTRASLAKILGNARPETRLWVLDLDVDHCRCEPPSPAFDRFVGLVLEFCRRNGVDIRTGTHVPPMLQACGFDVDPVEVEPFNNREIDRARFTTYLLREALLYDYLLGGMAGEEVVGPLGKFLARQESDASQFVQYGMAMLSAVKRNDWRGLR